MQVTVDVPDQKGRLQILKVHARNKKLDGEVDLEAVSSCSSSGGLKGVAVSQVPKKLRAAP